MQTAIKQERAITYIRVSTEEQELGTSPEEQVEVTRDWAQRLKSYRIVEELDDLGFSGARYQSRPGIVRAISLIEGGMADVLMVTKLDRLGRNAKIVLDIAERVNAAGGRIETCDGMTYGGPMGQLMLTQLAAFAQFERDMIRDRTRSGSLRRAKQGVQPSITRPFGYRIITRADSERTGEARGTYVIIEEEAQYLREMFRRYAAGASVRGIAAWLRSAGVVTTKGNAFWQAPTVHKMLLNPVYIGNPGYNRRACYQKELADGSYKWITEHRPQSEWIDLKAPALVDEETFNCVQVRLKTGREERSGRERANLLAGFLPCPLCGMRLIARMNGKTRMYVCRQSFGSYTNGHGKLCEGIKLDADDIEAKVLGMVAEYAENPEQLEIAARSALDTGYGDFDGTKYAELKAKLADVEARERATAEAQVKALAASRSTDVYDGILSDIDLQRKGIKSDMAVLEKAKGQLAASNVTEIAGVMAGVMRSVHKALAADTLTLAEKAALLSTVLETVTVRGETAEVKLRADALYSQQTVNHVKPQFTVCIKRAA